MVRRGVIGSLSATSSPANATSDPATPSDEENRRASRPAPGSKRPCWDSMASRATGTWERRPVTNPSSSALAGGGSGGSGEGIRSTAAPWVRRGA